MHRAKYVVLDRALVKLSPWVTLVSRTVSSLRGAQPEEYHSFQQADYVGILGMLPDGRVPLVRQYRPALERETLELPGGLLEQGELPGACALREIAEETGYGATEAPWLLGRLDPDTGRLENRLWCYVAKLSAERAAGWRAEPGIASVICTRAELRSAIADGSFSHALHIALIGLALTYGVFYWD